MGGTVADDLPNAEWGTGDWLVVEADESDRSMLSLNVEIAVLTNVELDHHATFGSLAELREAFRAFLNDPPCAVVWDRPELLELRAGPSNPGTREEVTRGPVRGLMLRLARARRCDLAVPEARGLARGQRRAGCRCRAESAAADRRRRCRRRLPWLSRRRPALSDAGCHRERSARV